MKVSGLVLTAFQKEIPQTVVCATENDLLSLYSVTKLHHMIFRELLNSVNVTFDMNSFLKNLKYARQTCFSVLAIPCGFLNHLKYSVIGCSLLLK